MEAIAGFFAGFVTTCILHPLDMIKTRFQVNPDRNKTLLSTIRSTSAQGLPTLYRGLSANMLGSCSSWAFYLFIYQYLKDNIHLHKQSTTPNSTLNSADYLLSSSFAGIVTVMLTNPVWVVKTRMCTTEASSPGAYRNVIHGLRMIFKLEGIKGLYKGLFPALFGVSHGAIQFMVYEKLKLNLSDKSIPNYIAMAALSKLFATCSTYPYQVVKSRMQNEHFTLKQDSKLTLLHDGDQKPKRYGRSFGTIKNIYRGEGLQGFYKGLGANCVRVLPGTCITFAVYEGLSRVFEEL